MTCIALEFEKDQILIAASNDRSARKIQDFFSVGIAGLDVEAIGKLLRSALSEHGLARCDAIVVVERSAVEMREFEVPPAPENELPAIVRFLAKNEFASLNDNWRLDFVPLQLDSDATRKVLAVGLPPDRYQPIAKIMELAGVRLRHIVLRPFAKFDLLKSFIEENESQLIVGPDADFTDMVVAVNHKVAATRSVRHGPDQQQSLASEIIRTLASARSSIGVRDINQIILIGDAKDYPDLMAELQGKTVADIQFVDPFQRIEFPVNRPRPEALLHYVPLFGALTQQFADSPHAIDFLNPRRPIVSKPDRSRMYLYGGIAAGVALLGLLAGWWTLRQQAAEIAEINQKLTALIASNAGETGQPGADQTMGEVTSIDQWQLANINWLEELHEFSSRLLTPDDAIVDSFDAIADVEKPRIVIRSRMIGIQKEAQLLNELYSRPYIIEPPTTGVSEEDASYPMSFDFTAALDRDPDAIIEQVDAQALKSRQQSPTPSSSSQAFDESGGN